MATQTQELLKQVNHIGEYGEKIAVVIGNNCCTYSELSNMIIKLKTFFVEANVKKNDSILIIGDRSITGIALILASISLGVMYIPVTSSNSVEFINKIANDCNAKLVFDSSIDQLFINHKNILSTIEIINNRDVLINSNPFYEIDVEGNDKFYTIYTSGTTGASKKVETTINNVSRLFDWYANYFHINFNSVIYLLTSIGFDLTQRNIICPLLKGSTLILPSFESGFDGDEIFDQLTRNQVTHCILTPSMLKTLKENYNLEKQFMRIEHLILGGELLRCSDINWIFKGDNHPTVSNLYGVTEDSGCATVYSFSDTLKGEIVPIGKPIPGKGIYIKGDEEIGEICISGFGITNQSNVFIHGGIKYYNSGDLGRYDGDGNIELIGRSDRVVKLNGKRVNLNQIDTEISKIDKQIINSYTTITNDNSLLISYLVVSDNNFSTDNLKKSLLKKLPNYMVPTIFEKINKLPLTKNGKFDILYLNENFRMDSLINDVINFIKSNNVTNNSIMNNSNVLELGFDSLNFIKLVATLKKEFSIDLSLSEVISKNSLFELRRYIRSKMSSEHMAQSNIFNNPGNTYPLLLIQKKIFSDCMSKKLEKAYTLNRIIELSPYITDESIYSSLSKLIEVHEALRIQFSYDDSLLIQRILETSKPKVEYSFVDEELEHYDIIHICKTEYEPFNLIDSNLIRFKIIKSSTRKYLYIEGHHLILDEYSMSIIIDDFKRLLRNNVIYEQEYSFKYFLSQQSFYNSKSLISDSLENSTNFTLLPEYKKIDYLNYDSDTKFIYLSQSDSEKLLEFSKKNKLTVFSVFASIVTILLSKYNYCDEIDFCHPQNMREGVIDNRLVGPCFEMSHINIKLFNNESFLSLASKIQKKVFNNIDHRKEDLNRVETSLDCMINSYEMSTNQFNFEEIIDLNEGKFNIEYNLIKYENRYTISIKFLKELFSSQFIDGMLDKFLFIYKQVLENKNINIDSIILANDEETLLLENTFNNTELIYNTQMTIVDLFDEAKNKHSSLEVLFDKNTSMSYCELDFLSNVLAREILNKRLPKNSKIGLISHRNISMIIGVLAIIKSGHCYVPINLKSKGMWKEIIYKANIPLLITSGIEIIDKDIDVGVIDIESLNNDRNNIKLEIIGSPTLPTDIAVSLFSSGTTGSPKCIEVTHGNIVNYINNSVQSILKASELQSSYLQSIIFLTEYTFDISITEFLMPLTYGIKVHIISDEKLYDNTYILNYVIEKNIDILQITPTRLRLLLIDDELFNEAIKTLKYIICGGEKLNINLLSELQSYNSKCRLINVYGPTETTVWATAFDCTYLDTKNKCSIPIGKR